MFTGLLKDMIKDAAEQPDEEIYEVWECPECRCFCPCELGYRHPLSVDVFIYLEIPGTLILLGFCEGFLT